MTRKRSPVQQCQAIVPAQLKRGVPWSPEHRCRHPAGPNGFCWQHQPVEDEGGAKAGAVGAVGELC
jgi:hypothetical protein